MESRKQARSQIISSLVMQEPNLARQSRIGLIRGFLVSLLILLLFRTAYLQVWDGPSSGAGLAARALKYRAQILTGEEYYRGEILDRNLLSLTDSGIRPTLVAFPTGITNIKDTSVLLEKSIDLKAEITEGLYKRSQGTYGNRAPVILKVNLNAEEIMLLEQADIPGLAVLPLKNRYGPGSLARHLIGHLNSIDEKQWRKLAAEKKTQENNNNLPTAYRRTDKIGVAGLEGKYENLLKGSRPQNRIMGIGDANGRLLQGLGYRIQEEPADTWRNHLVLTLDRRYQEIVERVLDNHISRGAVAIIEIESGDVLALASRPNYDQNRVSNYLQGYDELLDRTDRAAFYPGSVFKMVTAAGVLEENLVSPGEVFECKGSYLFSDNTEIKCLQPHGSINLAEAINKSCNTTFIQLGLRLGSEKLAAYAARLGFNVNLGNSSPPALVGNTSIGQQGVLVSPLQIANLYATLARNGTYLPWRVLAGVRNYQGDLIQEFPVQPPRQVLSPDTCAVLNQALLETARNGSGKTAWVENLGTAGKTGTAQANDSKRVIAWFAGFTPADNPRLAIAVMVEENTRGASTGLRGGETAAPIFKEIAQEILQLEMAP